MTANKERGEFEIELGGVVYGLRPSWEAIEAFEGAGGMMLIQMMFAASNGQLSLRVSAAIVTECIKAWGKATKNVAVQGFQVERIAPLLMEAGMVNVQATLAPMLTLAVTGGLKSTGEVKPSAESPEKTLDGSDSKASPAARSGGSRGNSGRRPRSNSTKR